MGSTIASTTASASGPDNNAPVSAVETTGAGLGNSTAASTSSWTVQVQVEDDDDEMPPLEPSYLGNPPAFLPNPQSPEMPLNTSPAGDVPEQPFTPISDQFQSPLPSAPLTGALASELLEMQQSASAYTAEELDEMPDMESPPDDVHLNIPHDHDSVSIGHNSALCSSRIYLPQDWSTEDEGEDEEEDQADEEDEESEAESTDEELDDAATDEGHGSMPHSASSPLSCLSSVSYPDGLPSNPFLPLALVSRSFLNAARTLLYSKHIHLNDAYQAHLFLRTLTSPQVSVYDDEPDADDEDARQQTMLSYRVRDVAFDIRNLISLGRGGGNLFIDILKNCPRLERVACTADFMRSAQKPLESALARCSNLRCIHLRGGDVPAKDLVWEVRNLASLLSKWPKLDNLQVLWLKHSINGPLLPAPKIQLKRLSLAHLDITDSDLSYLLKGSKGTLKQLDLHRPTSKLTRVGVARVLIEHGPTLTSLQLDVNPSWHPMTAAAPPAEASNVTEDRAGKCRYLLDGLTGHLKVLEELKLSGSLASTILLARLPKTITVLAFQDNLAIDVAKMLTLLKKKVRRDGLNCSNTFANVN